MKLYSCAEQSAAQAKGIILQQQCIQVAWPLRWRVSHGSRRTPTMPICAWVWLAATQLRLKCCCLSDRRAPVLGSCGCVISRSCVIVVLKTACSGCHVRIHIDAHMLSAASSMSTHPRFISTSLVIVYAPAGYRSASPAHAANRGHAREGDSAQHCAARNFSRGHCFELARAAANAREQGTMAL